MLIKSYCGRSSMFVVVSGIPWLITGDQSMPRDKRDRT